MQPDPQRVADTRAWLSRARIDLRAAEHERSAEPPLTADIVFHAQQLAEKSMKALLTWHDEPFRKTHDLVEIGGQCVALDPSLEPLLRRAAPLSEYAWRYRYPGEPHDPSVAEAASAMQVAEEVHQAVLTRLPTEARA